DRITSTGFMMLPKHVKDRGGDIKKQLIGTGPMRITSADTDKWTKVEFERNPFYWREGRPYLDAAEVTYGLDLSARMAAFCGKENDSIVLTDQAQLATLKTCAPGA